MVLGLLLALPFLSGCTQTAAEADSAAEPAKVEQIAASEVSRLTLTAQAADRLSIATTRVREADVDGKRRKVVPYEAVLYDPEGATWVYVSPEPLSFVRERIQVLHIHDGRAVLSKGPSTGTAVVTVGVSELHGTETGVGH